MQALLQKEDIREEVETERYRDGVLRDYCDGEFARKVSADETTLLLAFYHDELEIANPLGSRRGKHKLGEQIYYFLDYNTCRI